MMLWHKEMRVLVMGGLIVVVVGCEEAPNTTVADDALTELEADAVIYEMDDYLEKDGIRSGRVQADSAYLFNDSSVVKLWTLDMTLYHEDGSERARVTSERGTMNDRTEKMVARGNVVVQMANSPERIESPELHYDPTRNRIWSDSATVRILPDGRTTRGTCFESDLELRNVRVCNPRGAVGETGMTGDGGAGGL
jgi:LPS export ABC transporter protein LptC